MNESDLLMLAQLLEQTPADASCGAEHISTEQALAWIDGELKEAQISESTKRVMSCAACAQNLRWVLDAARWSDALLSDAQQIVAESNPASPQSDQAAGRQENAVTQIRHTKPEPSRWRRTRARSRALAAGLAACLALTFGAWVMRETANNTDSDRLRAAPGSTQPAHRSLLTHTPALFQWECLDSAAKHFELLDQSGQILIELVTTQCQIAEIASTKNLGSGVYVWQVRDAGSQVTNGPFVFEIQ